MARLHYNMTHNTTSKNSLSILTWNLEGLITSDGTNKLRLPMVLNIVHRYDIICLNETWQDNDNNTNLNGYKQYTSFRSFKHKNAKRNSGGVAVLIKNNIAKGVSKLKSASDDSIWLKLDKNFFGLEKNLYLCCCYLIPQNSSTLTWNDINNCEILETEVLSYSNFGHVLICGDLNARTSNLKDYTINDNDNSNFQTIPLPPNYNYDNFHVNRNNSDIITNDWGHFIVDLCISASLCILNGRTNGDITGKCTCIKKTGTSAVDLNIITKDLFNDVNYFQVKDFTEWSDHCPVAMSIKVNKNITTNAPMSQLTDLPPKYIWDRNKSDMFVNNIADQSNLLSSICEDSFDNVDNITKAIGTILTNAAKTTLKLVRIKKKKRKTYFNSKSTCHSIRTHLLHTKKLLTKYPNNRYIRECYYDIKKIYKKAVIKAKQKYRDNILSKLEELKSKNPREHWQLLNKLRNQEKQDYSSSINADEWISHFNKLFTPDYDDSALKRQLEDIKPEAESYNSLDYIITENEVYDSINSLKNNKTSGPDGILNEMLKCGKYYLVKPIIKLFNLILNKTTVPKEWKKGYLTVIYKSGDINLPGNYRGLAICSCLGKLFTKTLNNRLQKKLETENIYSKHQAGFRRDYRTSDNVYILSQITKYYKSKKQKLFTCFVDFRKAFDTISRPALFLKMSKMKIGGNFLKAIESLYEGDSFNIKMNNSLTEAVKCHQGVRQGDGLSSTLFNIFINDLSNLFNEANSRPASLGNTAIGCLLYADDLVIMSESQEGLQCSINKLSMYCKRWHLKVNINKTQVVIFNSKGKMRDIVKYNQETIQTVSSYKYLGVIFHRSCTFSEAVNTLSSKGLKALYAMQKSLYSDTKSPIKIHLKIFDAVIVPILTYCAEIWGQDLLHNKQNYTADFTDDKSRMEVVHMRFCKRLLKVPQITSNIAVRSELGRLPLINNVIQQIMKYYVRLESMNENRLAKMVYSQTQKSSFSIKNIIKHYSNYLDIDISNVNFTEKKQQKQFIKTFKDNWLTNAEEEWYERLNSHKGVSNDRNKLRLYSKIKNSLSAEKYLEYIKNPQIRQSLTKLRISAHTLAIEKDRHTKTGKTPITQRICKCCNSNMVENEYHFVMKCPLYTTERSQLYSEINVTSTAAPTEELFLNLMYCNIENTTKAFGNFLTSIFKKRKQYFSV